MTVSYTPETFTFTADSTTSTLKFYTPDTSGYGPIIDNVVVTPEPASLALVGLGGLALMSRRRPGASASPG